MRGLWEGELELNQDVIAPLDRCLDCRACETACPSGVRYGEILEATRAELEKSQPKRGIAAWLTRNLLWHVVAKQKRLRSEGPTLWGEPFGDSMGPVQRNIQIIISMFMFNRPNPPT